MYTNCLNISDFYRHSCSDFTDRYLLSKLGVFVVASAIGVSDRITPMAYMKKPYNLISKTGTRISVRTSSYSFLADGNEPGGLYYEAVQTKGTDLFVFCTHKGLNLIDSALDTSLWDFYILRSESLNIDKLKTITMSHILELKAIQCSYDNLLNQINITMNV